MKEKHLYIFVVFIASLGLGSCDREIAGLYDSGSYIRFYTSNTMTPSANFIAGPTPVVSLAVSQSNPRDTAYFRLQAVGELSDRPRQIKIKQFVDATQVQLVPEAGVNFIPFESSQMAELFTLPAGEMYIDVPIIIISDPGQEGGAQKNFRLTFQLVESDDFKIVSSHRKGALTYFQR